MALSVSLVHIQNETPTIKGAINEKIKICRGRLWQSIPKGVSKIQIMPPAIRQTAIYAII
jgi:hypothetical protein